MHLGLTETQRERRGHDFYEIPVQTPRLYATEKVAPKDKTIWVHYFGPSQNWWIAEVNSDGMAFGYADLGFGGGEWGNIYLPELEAVNVHGGLVIIERDCFWTPKTFWEVMADD